MLVVLKGFERLFEFVVGDVSVDLRGGDLGVAEGFGDQEQVAGAAVKGRGEGVAQAVDGDLPVQPGPGEPELHAGLHLAGADAGVAVGKEHSVGVGGDPVIGTPFPEMVRLFEADVLTEVILIVGEIGGSMEEETAALVRDGEVRKPVVAYIAGRNAPEGKRMGHAGAIVAGGRGSIASKLAAFEAAGIPVAEVPGDVVGLVRNALKELRLKGFPR